MEEVWKVIPGYSGAYEASSLGRIRSTPRWRNGGTIPAFLKGQILQPSLDKDGYLFVSIQFEKEGVGRRVSRLVAESFHSNPNNWPVVNHKDGNKANNHASNLEWCTVSYNTQHSFDNGLQIGIKGAENAGAKLDEFQIRVIKSIGAELSDSVLGDYFKISCEVVRGIQNNTRWKHVAQPTLPLPKDFERYSKNKKVKVKLVK